MPSAPANSASTAAATGSGSTVRRAWRMVAIWSMFTPSVGNPSISLSTVHRDLSYLKLLTKCLVKNVQVDFYQ